MFKYQKSSSGFTLIELLVVIAIIGVLASTVLASLQSVRSQARDTQRLAEAKELMKALEVYRLQYNGYPCSTAGMTSANDMNCANGTADAAAQIVFKRRSGTVNSSETIFQTALNFYPAADSVQNSSLLYNAYSPGGTNNPVNRSGYTIRVYSEVNSYGYGTATSTLSNKYCRISTGPSVDPRWLLMPVCDIQGIN